MGFMCGVQYVLRLVEDGLLHGGPPCGTYVWVNRGTSGRSKSAPDGFSHVESVKIANLILGFCLCSPFFSSSTFVL